jgi:enoyl-CoA hydratase
VRAVRAGGVAEADRRTPGQFGPLFATQDLQAAVESFLSEGPGKAKFEGR